MVLSTLEDLMQIAKTKKQNAEDSEEARHWAVVYTELEKIAAYVQVHLPRKTSEEE